MNEEKIWCIYTVESFIQSQKMKLSFVVKLMERENILLSELS